MNLKLYRKDGKNLDNIGIILERHEQRIKTLERDIKELQDIRSELKTMSETLVELATELKHTNEHLIKNEKKIENEEVVYRV